MLAGWRVGIAEPVGRAERPTAAVRQSDPFMRWIQTPIGAFMWPSASTIDKNKCTRTGARWGRISGIGDYDLYESQT